MEEIEVLEGGACMHAVMSALAQLPEARRLTLHRLLPPALAAVASVLLPVTTSLTAVSLDHGALSPATVFDLARALAVNTTLRVLSVRRCALHADSLCELVEMLEENQTLEELDVSWSAEGAGRGRGGEGEGGAAPWAALRALARNTVLEVLRLRGCGLGDAAVVEVAAAVRGNAQLRVLDVSCNPWTWRSAEALGEMLREAPALERVEVERCGLSRWGAWTLLRACAARQAPPVIDLRQVRRSSSLRHVYADMCSDTFFAGSGSMHVHNPTDTQVCNCTIVRNPSNFLHRATHHFSLFYGTQSECSQGPGGVHPHELTQCSCLPSIFRTDRRCRGHPGIS